MCHLVHKPYVYIFLKVLLVGSLTVELQDEDEEMGSYLRTIYVLSAFLLIPMSVALGVLLGWHIYLILQNKTTIEVVLLLSLLLLSTSSVARLWMFLAQS